MTTDFLGEGIAGVSGPVGPSTLPSPKPLTHAGSMRILRGGRFSRRGEGLLTCQRSSTSPLLEDLSRMFRVLRSDRFLGGNYQILYAREVFFDFKLLY